MSLGIDLVLIGIVALCGWRGFRTGIINGVCWILAIIIALYCANLASTAYHREFSDIVEPFALSVVERTIWGEDSQEEGETVIEPDLDDRENLDPHEVSMTAMEKLGFSEGAALSIADDVAATNEKVNNAMMEELTELICQRISYVVIFAIAFILIAIIFTVIGNVFDFAFGLPGHENLNHITGLALGIIRGILIVMVIGCFARYTGLLLSREIVGQTFILSKFVEANKIAALLNI